MRSHLKLMHMSAKIGMRQNKDLSSFMRDDALDCICPDGTREKMDAGNMERMKFIGITGGVGAGKSEILHYLETKVTYFFQQFNHSIVISSIFSALFLYFRLFCQ